MFRTSVINNQPRSSNFYAVLLVDSCPNNIQTYRQYLQQDTDRHYQIVEAFTLYDALQLWKSQDFDLIVLTINLSNCIGLDLLREIDRDQPWIKLPVIVITTQAEQELALQAMKLGASDYLITQNVTNDTFCRAINNVIDQVNLTKKILSLQKREEILGKIALSIRRFLQLEKIYEVVVTEIQAFLQVDRVLIYKFEKNKIWQIVAEKVVPPWLSCLDRHVIDECFQHDLQNDYRQGRSSAISDINTADLTECHRQFLQNFQVKANIAVPILLPDYEDLEEDILWGVLIIHQCSHPRYWDEMDLPLLETLSVQIGIALHQAALYENLQNVNKLLEDQVVERTQKLENLLSEYRQAEKELKFHSCILDEIHDAVISADVHGIIQTWNKAAEKLYGYEPQEIIGQPLSCLCSLPEEFTEKVINPLLQKGEYQLETLALSKYGQKFHVDVRLSLIKDEQGNITNFLACSHNITARKTAEIALQKLNEELEQRIDVRTADLQSSENRLQDVLQFARITNWQLDLITQKYICSPEIFNILRINPPEKELTYDQMITYFVPDNCLSPENLIDQLGESVEPRVTICQVLRGDGTVGHVLSKARIHFNTEGIVSQISGIMMDISEWQEAEENFKNSEQRFATVAQTIPVAIFCLNQQGECIYVNNFWSKITGQSIQNTLGKSWLEAFHPDDQMRIHKSWLASLTDSSSYQTEGRTVRPDGSICWFYCQIVWEFDSTGQHIGYIGTLTDISDRKANEQILRNLSTRLELAVKSADLGIWECDLIEDQIIWNSRMYELYNLLPEEIDLTSNALAKFYSFIHPDDLPNLLAEVGAMVRGENNLDTEFRIIWQNGMIRNIKVYAVLRFDDDQKPKSMIGINYDITERKEAEQEILRSRDLWQAVFHKSADALILANGLLSIDCNDKAVEMFEANRKEDLLGIMGNSLQKKPFTESEIQSIYNQMIQQGFSVLEIEYVSFKGKTFWGNVVSKPIMVAGQSLNLVRITDISDRKEAEIALQESQKFIQTVIETIPIPFFWKDRNSVFLGCNQQLSQVIGLTPKDLIGKTDLEILPSSSDALAYYQDDQEIMASGQARLAFSETFTTEQGETRWLESHKAPLRDGENNVIGIVCMFQDITERKQVEDQLQTTNAKLAKATRLKDEFLASMSHELRTPLNAILGMSEGMLDKVFGEITLPQEKAIRLIERSGKHLLDLINDILDLSKIEAGKLTLDFNVVSVSSLCHNSVDIVEQIALNKNIQLSTQIVTNIQNIWVDERRIRQVLINLLNNAIKFTPSGGKVSLSVTDTEGEILFSVTDTGIGIEEVNLQNIFQPFVQIDSSLNRQHTGTGLGLALVEKIVSQHQGYLSVTSTLGKGSCFIIHLPYYPLSMLSCANNQTSEYTSITGNNTILGRSPLILLADDNEGNRQTMEDYLVHKGYQMLLAPNGEEAITIAKNHRPDIILMDIQMPRLSGLEAISIIRSDVALSNIPIIAITALALPGDEEKCLMAGANKYLTKPVRFKTLLETIENLLLPQNQ